MAKQTTSKLPSKPAAASSTVAKKAAPAGGGGTGTTGARRPQRISVLTFFAESRAELRKVTWPTREQTLNLTGAVIAMTLGIAAFLGLVDGALDFIIKPLIGAK